MPKFEILHTIPDNKEDKERHVAEHFLKHANFQINSSIRNAPPPAPDIVVEISQPEFGHVGVELTRIVIPQGRKDEKPHKVKYLQRETVSKLECLNCFTGRIVIDVMFHNSFSDDYKLPSPEALAEVLNKFIQNNLDEVFFENYSFRRQHKLEVPTKLAGCIKDIFVSPGKPIQNDPTIFRVNQPKLVLHLASSYSTEEIAKRACQNVEKKIAKQYSRGLCKEIWLLAWTFGNNFMSLDFQDAVIKGMKRVSKKGTEFDRLYYYHLCAVSPNLVRIG